jgi:hypothetical protein
MRFKIVNKFILEDKFLKSNQPTNKRSLMEDKKNGSMFFIVGN